MRLLRQDPFFAKTLLVQGAAVAQIRRGIERHITIRERISTSIEVPLTEDSKQILHLAMEESEKLGMRHVGTEHILLALLSVETSLAAQLLHARGLTAAEVRAHLSKAPQSSSVSLKSENTEELIEFFSQSAQSIDIFGKRWNREEMVKIFCNALRPIRQEKRNVSCRENNRGRQRPICCQRSLKKRNSRQHATHLDAPHDCRTH